MLEKMKGLLEESVEVKRWSQPGCCRLWTDRAISILNDSLKDVRGVIPVEVNVGPWLRHSFVRLEDENGVVYLFDGVGVGKHDPFFGMESEAPEHLREYKPDLLILTARNMGIEY